MESQVKKMLLINCNNGNLVASTGWIRTKGQARRREDLYHDHQGCTTGVIWYSNEKLSILLETQMFISQSELVLREVPTPCNSRSDQCLPLLVSSKRMMRIVDSSGLNWSL